MTTLKIHSPSIVCAFWAVVFAAGASGSETIALALATIAVSIVLHTCAIIQNHRRR